MAVDFEAGPLASSYNWDQSMSLPAGILRVRRRNIGSTFYQLWLGSTNFGPTFIQHLANGAAVYAERKYRAKNNVHLVER